MSVPKEDCPILRVPSGVIATAGASVGWGIASGTAVGAPSGIAVGESCDATVGEACDATVGGASETAVGAAEPPQATATTIIKTKGTQNTALVKGSFETTVIPPKFRNQDLGLLQSPE
jgi:hypothetical protein